MSTFDSLHGLGLERLLELVIEDYLVESSEPGFEDAIMKATEDEPGAQDLDHIKTYVCTNCLKSTPHKLQACARCKSAQYCSKKCQKEDWPEHKKVCLTTAEMDHASVCKAMARFYSKSGLASYVQTAIICKMRSLNLKPSRDEVFTARVRIGIEPVDIHDLGKLLLTPTFVETATCPIGMLQILDVDIFGPPVMVKSRPDYTQLRDSLDVRGFDFLPILTLQMVHTKPAARPDYRSYATNMNMAFVASKIPEGPATIAIPTISDNKGSVEKPRTHDTCLEYINMCIRQDHGNFRHARIKMLREDMKSIHMIWPKKHPAEPNVSVLAWVGKFLREDVYGLLPATKLFRAVQNLEDNHDSQESDSALVRVT